MKLETGAARNPRPQSIELLRILSHPAAGLIPKPVALEHVSGLTRHCDHAGLRCVCQLEKGSAIVTPVTTLVVYDDECRRLVSETDGFVPVLFQPATVLCGRAA